MRLLQLFDVFISLLLRSENHLCRFVKQIHVTFLPRQMDVCRDFMDIILLWRENRLPKIDDRHFVFCQSNLPAALPVV